MFPPVDTADEDGLLCWGGELSPPLLREAYREGVFPWPHEGMPLLWFAPPRRALLFVEEFDLGKRTQRYLRRAGFEIRVNTCFETVMRACGAPRRYQGEWETGTWVTDKMVATYCAMHRSGEAHSVEAWKDDELVGGLYGVSWGNYFSGESMFYRHPHASRAALAWLVKHLKSQGAPWLDCQLMTPHFLAMGAREVERPLYMEYLKEAIHAPVRLFD